MANILTGEFDIVAEFATLAVNRVLAAMHRTERFPHSMTIRVDDNPPPGGKGKHSILGVIDGFGDPVVDHTRIGLPVPLSGHFAATDPGLSSLDLLVNSDQIVATEVNIIPSHLQGRAQLQLFPPTLELAGVLGSSITVKVPLMARYFPDPQTSPLAEFIRGEVQITAAVNQIASPDPKNMRALDVDIRGANVAISFSTQWSSHPLTAEDLAGVNLLIRNAFRTSFLPSSNLLPDNVNFVQFKTMHTLQSAVTVLVNMNTARGNPASMNNIFLGGTDDFALAAGRDFILAAFPEVHDQRVQQFGAYAVSNTTQTLDLQDGQFFFKLTGHVHRTSFPHVDFDFTATQALTLNLISTSPGGPFKTAQLLPLGDISLTIEGGILGWIVNQFSGFFLGTARQKRDSAVSNAQSSVMNMLNVDDRLGAFLQSLLKPPAQEAGAPPPQELKPILGYTAVEIRSSGILLHGTLAVQDWPPAHVEYEPIPSTSGGPLGPGGLVGGGPDYSALKTWIPGGYIQQYEWSYRGQTQPVIDQNRFVKIQAPPQSTISDAELSTVEVPAFTPLCLTVRGTRLSASGPIVSQPVSATACGYRILPVLQGLETTRAGASLAVALTQPGPGGLVEVAGYAATPATGANGDAPNRIVHFADDRSAEALDLLPQALLESGRKEAQSVIVAVLTAGQLAKASYVADLIYAEDQGGAWERAFGVKTGGRALTLIVGPAGKLLWQHQGVLDKPTLAAACKKFLVPAGPVASRMLNLNLRIGRPAPNFVFELAPGRGLTLRKLAGAPVNLVFWRCSSAPSIEALRELQKPAGKSAARSPIVLAINDGDAPELAKRIVAENKLTATLVVDPQRSISLAYGVGIWPTIVSLDAYGAVTGIRYGRLANGPAVSPAGTKTAASS